MQNASSAPLENNIWQYRHKCVTKHHLDDQGVKNALSYPMEPDNIPAKRQKTYSAMELNRQNKLQRDLIQEDIKQLKNSPKRQAENYYYSHE